MSETTDAWDQLKKSGYFDTVDKEVHELMLKDTTPMDANQVWQMLPHFKYNLIQQAFTRLTKEKKLYKHGTHKGVSGFTRGVYSVTYGPPPEQQEELFNVTTRR